MIRRRRPLAQDGAPAREPDRGSGLIEILVAVVLLGLGATGTLTAVAAAIKGSSQEARLTGARRWLVSATDYVVSPNVPRVACTGGEAAVRSAYQTAIRNVATSRPDGWVAAQITVVAPVTFWNGSGFGSTCYETSGLRLQQFTVRVQSPDGQQVETITVVKGDV